MSKEITTETGAKVILNEADFKTGQKLLSTVNRAARKLGYSVAELDGLKTLELLGDEDLIEILFICLKRCTYNGEKITEAVFETVANRVDYYPILQECLGLNYAVFMPALSSK